MSPPLNKTLRGLKSKCVLLGQFSLQSELNYFSSSSQGQGPVSSMFIAYTNSPTKTMLKLRTFQCLAQDPAPPENLTY